MKQKIAVSTLGLLILAGLMFFSSTPNSGIAATDMTGDSCYTTPGATLESKVVTSDKAPMFNGIAYIAGHGGHIAIIDMRTMKSPMDVEKDRIVLTEAGSEMEGKIAGMSFEEVKKAGGTHGQALIEEKGKKVMIAGTLSGNVYKIDMATGKKQGPIQIGQKFCGTIVGPDGKVYLEDMADGNVYVMDAGTLKTVDKMPVGAAVCGIQWTKNAKKAYITDMPLGKVYVYDWTTKKKISEITSPEMTFIHQARMTPDGRYLWVSAPNEFDPGLKPGTHKSQVIVIDTTKDEIIKRIILPDSVRPHDFAFTKDGKYALLTSRSYADDSQLNIMDLKNGNIVRQVSACASCHKASGIEVKVDKGSPLLCGIEVDWSPSK
ncbi:MAG: YncE family protein [Nitrospirae bacterium]|nr:YncE family protein [Nitrospirota bacterium]